MLRGVFEGIGRDNGLGSTTRLSSDGNTLAFSSSLPLEGSDADRANVQVFDWDESASNWKQRGNPIESEASGVRGAGLSLSADGNSLVMSNSSNSDNGVWSGLVRFFEWDGSNWIQRGKI